MSKPKPLGFVVPPFGDTMKPATVTVVPVTDASGLSIAHAIGAVVCFFSGMAAYLMAHPDGKRVLSRERGGAGLINGSAWGWNALSHDSPFWRFVRDAWSGDVDAIVRDCAPLVARYFVPSLTAANPWLDSFGVPETPGNDVRAFMARASTSKRLAVFARDHGVTGDWNRSALMRAMVSIYMAPPFYWPMALLNAPICRSVADIGRTRYFPGIPLMLDAVGRGYVPPAPPSTDATSDV